MGIPLAPANDGSIRVAHTHAAADVLHSYFRIGYDHLHDFWLVSRAGQDAVAAVNRNCIAIRQALGCVFYSVVFASSGNAPVTGAEWPLSGPNWVEQVGYDSRDVMYQNCFLAGFLCSLGMCRKNKCYYYRTWDPPNISKHNLGFTGQGPVVSRIGFTPK